jgi:hypothetical protein
MTCPETSLCVQYIGVVNITVSCFHWHLIQLSRIFHNWFNESDFSGDLFFHYWGCNFQHRYRNTDSFLFRWSNAYLLNSSCHFIENIHTFWSYKYSTFEFEESVWSLARLCWSHLNGEHGQRFDTAASSLPTCPGIYGISNTGNRI